MRKIITILLIAMLMFAGCNTSRRTTSINNTTTVQVDTIRETRIETVHDTTFQLIADSSFFEAMIECDSNYKAYIREFNSSNGKKIQTKYIFKDKILRVDCKINEDSISHHWKDIYEAKYQVSMDSTAVVTATTDKKKVGGFFSNLKGLLIALLVGFVIGITKKYWWGFIRKMITGV